MSIEIIRENNVVVFQFENAFVSARPKHGNRRERNAASRIYVFGHDLTTMEDPYEFSKRTSGQMVTTRGDYPEVDAYFDKFNRALIKNYRTHLATYREQLSADIIPTKLSWSKYAGCSCPCSQGFIADRQIVIEGMGAVDLFVENGNWRQIMAANEAKRAESAKAKALKDLAEAQAKVDALV